MPQNPIPIEAGAAWVPFVAIRWLLESEKLRASLLETLFALHDLLVRDISETLGHWSRLCRNAVCVEQPPERTVRDQLDAATSSSDPLSRAETSVRRERSRRTGDG